jgi:hypothetical protein
MGVVRAQSELMTSSITGGPRILLRVEGAAAFAAGIAAFAHLGGTWRVFALLFLVPDLSMLGYLASARAGAIAYNAAHSYLFATALAALGLGLGAQLPLLLAALAAAHVGFDRALGYGLKYATGFTDTHLGRIGRARRSAAVDQAAAAVR